MVLLISLYETIEFRYESYYNVNILKADFKKKYLCTKLVQLLFFENMILSCLYFKIQIRNFDK